MGGKKRLHPATRFLGKLFILLLIGAGGYFIGSHQETLQSFFEQHRPTAEAYLQSARKNIAGLLKQGTNQAGSLAHHSFNRGRTLLHEISRPPAFKEQAAPPIVSKSLSAGTISISSFNIRILSDKSRTDHELKLIAQILQHYDLIALQELRDEQVLRRTVHILRDMGYPYNYEISSPVGRGVKEHYAFLYRRDKISVKQKGQLYDDPHDEFAREPYYASFQSHNFDFTLVTIHLLYGENEQQRRRELTHLAKIYDIIQQDNPQEQDVIVLGDFNFPPQDVGWEPMKLKPAMTYLIKPPITTTVTDTSLYDNFWFQQNYVQEYNGRSGVIKFDENMFHNDDRLASRTVSDHRPIWAQFVTTLPDDD
jgi:endonuclease/exonuclease/phosphatase family metal-dependent hydrolase